MATARARPRRIAFRLAGVLLGAFLALLFAEIALRVAWRTPRLPAPPGSLANDPELGLFHAPGFDGRLNTPDARVRLRYDSHGLRDDDPPLAKPPGEWRVLALGDSFVEGHGVEYAEAFATRLERAIPPPEGFARVEVVNAGVGGWGPVEATRYLRARGLAFEPDFVLLFFYVGNDFDDALAPDRYVEFAGIRVERSIAESAAFARRARIELRKRAFLYGAVADLVRALRTGEAARRAEDVAVARLLAPPGPDSAALEVVRAKCAEAKAACAAAGADFAVVVLPHRLQVERRRLEATAAFLGEDPASFDPDRPARDLRELLAGIEVEMFDAAAALRAHADATDGEVGLGADSHYDSDAHAVVAEAVAGWLAARTKRRTD